jgi:hypothetical protein
MAQVIAALDAPLAVAGFQVISSVVDSGPLHLSGPDGLTSHSIVTLRYRMQPT